MRTSLFPANRAEAGFSLLETLLALAVLALAATLTAVAAPRLWSGSDSKTVSEQIAALLRQAHREAIQNQKRVTVRFGTGFAEAALSNRRKTLRWSTDIDMRLVTAGELGFRDPVIVFLPDGSSSGGRIEFKAGERLHGLEIGWAGSRISRHE